MKKRIERSLGFAKQAALEKIGAAEHTDVPEITENNAKVKQDKLLLEEFSKSLEKQMSLINGFVEQGEHIKTNVNEWEKITMERSINFKLVEGFKRFGEYQQTLNQHFAKLEYTLGDKAFNPVRELIKGEIAEARAAKKKWKKTRQLYDASESKINSGDKGRASKMVDHNNIESEYSKAESYAEKCLVNALKTEEKCFVELVNAYWNVYYDHFKNGLKMLENMKSSLDSLQLVAASSEVSQRDLSKKNISLDKKSGSSHIIPPTLPVHSSSPVSGSPINSPHLSSVSTSSISPVPATTMPDKVHRSDSARSINGEKSRLFGENLQVIWENEGKTIPKNIVEIFQHIEEHGPSEEQLFKDPGNSKNLEKMRSGLNKGRPLNSCGALGDTLTVATLLKQWLSELPEPLLTYKLYQNYVDTIGVTPTHQKMTKIQQLNTQLHPSHKIILCLLLRACNNICMGGKTDAAEKRKTMLAQDLAIDVSIALGPRILRPPAGVAVEQNAEDDKAVNLFKFMILSAEILFPNDCEEMFKISQIMGNEKQNVQKNQNSSPTPIPHHLQTQSQTQNQSPPQRRSTQMPAVPNQVKSQSSMTPNRGPRITMLATDIIGSLDIIKLRATATNSLEECGPMMVSIKAITQDMETIKSLLKSTPRTEKPPTAVSSEDKTKKAKAVIDMVATEIQNILQAVKNDAERFSNEEAEVVMEQLQKVQGLLPN